MASDANPARNAPTRTLLSGLLVLLAVAAVMTAGCGKSDLGAVTGRVTMDGKPLPNAFVEFIPTGGQGSVSYGKTDDNG